ncbi:MAG: VWA domain-containing protein [Planctomycetes bacterium]|nr:VWA domain-containing protein [Planctomycetota bacterium]
MWDWAHPYHLAWLVPAWALLVWFHRRTTLPLARARRHTLLCVRATAVLLAVLALAGPAVRRTTGGRALIFLLDHSRSQGPAGMQAQQAAAERLLARLDPNTQVGFVSAGVHPVLRCPPARAGAARPPAPDAALAERDGAQTDLAAALDLARGLFPPGTARRAVLLGDGMETRGQLAAAAREAALADIVLDALPIAGPARPDVRVVSLTPSRTRTHEGASLALAAQVESTLAGSGRLRLFENGVEVESRELTLAPGAAVVEEFRRTPDARNLFRYEARLEGFAGDTIPENDAAAALVDVAGRPALLYVEGEAAEAGHLGQAMAAEWLRLSLRAPEGLPESVEGLAGFDGVILSDVPARRVSERAMGALREYVEHLGGGLVVIGGPNSFGAGGYFRTPLEELLPVRIRNPGLEERAAVALALVIDRSGSMAGAKLEICKSAAVATIELLKRADWVGVVAFDSAALWVAPMERLGSVPAVADRIAGLMSGGGTCIMPGMQEAHAALARTGAKAKHMIVLTDGQTEGSGYAEYAGRIRGEGITVSTVAVGEGADGTLLAAVAAAGGGRFYAALDPATIPRIFTQDTMAHLGRLVREEPFRPRAVETHPMLKGWAAEQAPELLGYVRTSRRATAQVPLVTDLGDPLLATWRFGLGKVTAFTSDCTSRWAPLWVAGWAGYGQFWGQVLRESAREPQGHTLDVRLAEAEDGRLRIVADALEDAARRKNDALLEADVYHAPAAAAGTALRHVARLLLEQQGPGRYAGELRLLDSGSYLVRARVGAETVSAVWVRNRSGEAAGGRTGRALLERVCALTGGRVLGPEEAVVEERDGRASWLDLTPFLVALFLAAFVADLATRRWESAAAIGAWARERWS